MIAAAGFAPTIFDQAVLDNVAREFLARCPMDMNMEHLFNGGLGPCWEWTGSRAKFGYGLFAPYPGMRVLAHRYSFSFFFGHIDESLGVLHRCDNPPCVRPSHLYQGDQRQNMLDAYARGRRPSLKGIRHKRRFGPDHCVNGHKLEPCKTRLEKRGEYSYLRCLVCENADQMRRYYKRTRRV